MTATTVIMEWNPPLNPNGKIYAYVIKFYKRGVCYLVYFWQCSECNNGQDVSIPSVSECRQTSQIKSPVLTQDIVNNANYRFSFTVINVESNIEHTFKVYAVNEAGNGIINEIQFTTVKSGKTKDQACRYFDECQKPLSCINSICDCGTPDLMYWDGALCQSKINHAGKCTSSSRCLDVTADCLPDTNNEERCLCKAGYYQNQDVGICHQVNELQIQSPTVISQKTDSIYFSWTVNVTNPSILYRIKHTPSTGLETASKYGGSLAGLTPGTEYEISIQSYIPANVFYDERHTEYAMTPVWTYPSLPGQFDLSESNLVNPPMTFAFYPASGNVAKYEVLISQREVTFVFTEVFDNKVTGLTLNPAESYDYLIITINGNGDRSQPVSGTFMGSSSALPVNKVQNLSILEKTAASVLLQWNPPLKSGVEIHSFVLQVIKNGSCVNTLVLKCSDCNNVQIPVFSECEKTEAKTEDFFTKAEINDSNHNFIVNVTSLTAYTEYTVKVYAFDEIGSGSALHKQFTTDESEPVFGDQVLTNDLSYAPTNSSISVSLCYSCFINSINGEITQAGLIVCVDKCTIGRRKRAVLSLDSFLQYPSWAEAKARKFNSPYRTTPDAWLSSLKTDRQFFYVIGDNLKCSTDPSQVMYCNGPLPSGSKIFVTAIACTLGGCQSQTSDYVFETLKTKGLDRGDSSDDNSGVNLEIIIPATLSITIIIIIIAVIIFCVRRKKSKDSPPQQELSCGQTGDNELNDLHQNESRRIQIKDFKENVTIMHKYSNLLFVKEFEDLQAISSKFKYPASGSHRHGDENQTHPGTPPLNTVIDACYIPGLNSNHEYIATQSPTQATAPHFWAMVWEQKSKFIIMLSDLMENGKTRADQYWPEITQPVRYGFYTIEMINVSKVEKCIIWELRISVGKMNHKVIQYFIPAWWESDNNISSLGFTQFLKSIRETMLTVIPGPLIVHCSAGIGWTGTFLALDYFMQFIERHSLDDYIDVFEYILEMRKKRRCMVQKQTQYIFIFDALVEVIQKKLEEGNIYDSLYYEQDNTDNKYRHLKVKSEKNVYDDVPHDFYQFKESKETDYEEPVSC